MDKYSVGLKAFKLNHNVTEIDKLVNRELKAGEFWYVLDNKWFQTFKQYLQSGDPVNNPGPIDNSDLFKVTENNRAKTLKEKLVEAEDFVYVPEELWNGLVKEFGLTGDKHIIKRKVIDRPTARSSYKILELYPVELKLCLHGTKQEIITAQFSQVTPLKELEQSIRTYFNVDEKSETQLWACGSLLNVYDPESESKKNDDTTLVDAGLSSGAIVTLEVRNTDGTWPSSRSRTSRSSKIVPGLGGLMPLGNTCFMNPSLQCLPNNPPLTDYYMMDKYWDVDKPLGIGGEIPKTINTMAIGTPIPGPSTANPSYTVTPMGLPPGVSLSSMTSSNSSTPGVSGTSTKRGAKNVEKPAAKVKKCLRAAGGQIWEDNTLAEWDPDDFRLFVGDLGNDVTDEVLTRGFSKYTSFVKAKVIRDKRTNKSKGYGFVSFKDPNDYIRAMREMDGKYLGSRPIKLRKSTWKERSLDVVKKKNREKAKFLS